MAPFGSDLVEGVVEAASNVISALSNSPAFHSKRYLTSVVKTAITQLVKVCVGGEREEEEEEEEDEKLKRRNGNNRDIAIEEGAVKNWRRRNRKDRQVGAQNGKVGA